MTDVSIHMAKEVRAKAVAAAVLELVEHRIPSDIVALLLGGDERGAVPPGALERAILAAMKTVLDELDAVKE